MSTRRLSFSLAAYVVRVRNAKTHKNETVSAFRDGKDLLDIAEDYLEDVKRQTSDIEADQQILRVPELIRERRYLTGVIETGNYGIESTLYNRKRKQDVHRRTRDEADMLPFFFILEVPDGTDEAILIVQRIGKYGIRKILYSELATRFRADFDDLRLRIDPLVLEKDMKQLLRQGRVTQIRFVKFGLSTDIADQYEGGHTESPGRTELVFHARRGDRFNLSAQIRELLSGRGVRKLFALEEYDFEYDTIKVALARNGHTKQVDLGNLMKLRSYHDVTDRLALRPSGHPELASIKQAALDLLGETEAQLYGRAGRQ